MIENIDDFEFDFRIQNPNFVEFSTNTTISGSLYVVNGQSWDIALNAPCCSVHFRHSYEYSICGLCQKSYNLELHDNRLVINFKTVDQLLIDEKTDPFFKIIVSDEIASLLGSLKLYLNNSSDDIIHHDFHSEEKRVQLLTNLLKNFFEKRSNTIQVRKV